MEEKVTPWTVGARVRVLFTPSHTGEAEIVEDNGGKYITVRFTRCTPPLVASYARRIIIPPNPSILKD